MPTDGKQTAATLDLHSRLDPRKKVCDCDKESRKVLLGDLLRQWPCLDIPQSGLLQNFVLRIPGNVRVIDRDLEFLACIEVSTGWCEHLVSSTFCFLFSRTEIRKDEGGFVYCCGFRADHAKKTA